MREALLRGIQKLCWLYPQLHTNIQYSEALSQEDVDVFAAFVNGHVKKILHDYPDEKTQESQIDSFLNSSTGVSKVHPKDVLFVETILAAAAGQDTSISFEMRGIVGFLRSHRKIWWSLHQAYEKILKNSVVGTCPLVIARPPLLDRIIPFGTKMHNFQEFHKLFHESIHYVLEENGICFGNEDLDEGLVTYFHEQVMGKKVCYLHYNGDEGDRYLKDAALFEKLLDPYPRSAVIPILQGSRKNT